MIKGFRRLNWKEGHQKAKKFFERLPSQSSQSKDSERDDGSDELVLPRHNFQDLDAGYGSDSESYIRRSAFTPTDQSRGSDRSSRKKSSKRLEKMSPITEGINSEDGNRYEDDMHDTELEVISEYELKPGPDAYRSLVEESFYTSEDDTDEDVRQKVEEDVGSQNPLNRSNSHCLPANTDPPRVEEKSALQRAEETYLKNLEERVKLDAEIADLTVRYEEWKRDLPDYVTTRNTAPSQRTASSLSTTQLRTLEREPVLYQQGGWQYGRRYGPGDIKLIDIAKKPLPPAPEGPAPEGPKHHCVRGGHIFQPIKIGLAPDNIAINNLAVRPYLHTQNGTKQHVHIPIKCDNCNRDVDEELWECEIPVCRLSVCYRCAIQMQQNSEVRALGSWAASASGSR
ncbi:hypothetical protein EJ04DRAFT_82592 [Polyplosphaeria fusca]|uniref:Uncharacterized protein n=1 Tax=Polyplosphaeria fusca TaxID=682080 RepID=A0A9P4QQI5_9PLEO|nr:hypothetical protein EJ04DRAFT_82592 [Polyplosphaeria fusca]